MRWRLGVVLSILLLGVSTSAARGESNAKGPLAISLPGKTWAVEVHAKGFVLDDDQSAPAGKRRIMASDNSRGLAVSIQLEQVDHEPTLDECRQYQRDRIKALSGRFDLKDVKYWDDGKMAFVEDFIPEYQGKPIKQRNLFACFSKEDVFVDVHISKTPFEPKEEVELSAVMGAVYVADLKSEIASNSSPDSMEYFREGSLLFNKGRFRESIGPYQKALDLEKQDSRLEKNFWRVLVDNLGMAYGVTGSLDKAKETFEYGVTQDKTYPLFYYNLTCAYAEKDDLDDTMVNLKTAFENKQNTIPGESMPDPRRDDSFQRFMQNKKFRELVDSLTKPSQ
jgi:tetratricopeptide (TPR) repeat protein